MLRGERRLEYPTGRVARPVHGLDRSRTSQERSPKLTSFEQPRLGDHPRLLLLVLARDEQASLADVLGQVPATLCEKFQVEALLIDDASNDATFEQATDMRRSGVLPFPLEVLSSSVPRGYGGCQKLGFQYAVDRRFDCVAVVDCAGDLGAANIEALLGPLVEGRADAASMAPAPGSRERWATRLVGRVVRRRVASLHAGLRAYRVEALRNIPFALDTGSRHIDTEVLIQFLFSGMRVVEVTPPYDRGSRGATPSWQHIRDALRAVVRARMQQMNLFYERRFDCAPQDRGNAHYELKLGFDSSHRRALAQVPRGSRVLDLGLRRRVLRAGSGARARLYGDRGRPGTACSGRRGQQVSPLRSRFWSTGPGLWKL